MRLEDIAQVRTGLVATRKKAKDAQAQKFKYKLLNLKCIAEPGYLDLAYTEEYVAGEPVKPDFLTQQGDILVRLSAPYTSVIIHEPECGYVIPSHFAIIRVDKALAIPEYVLWVLKRNSTMKTIEQNTSGSTAFGTISSGFISNLKIRAIPIDKQKVIGQLQLLSEKEQKLLTELAFEKQKYNRAAIDKIYDSCKRGKEI